MKPHPRRWYVYGLKGVKKAVKNGEAKSIIIAANIVQWELSDENVDHQLAEILEMCKIKVIMSTSRKPKPEERN